MQLQVNLIIFIIWPSLSHATRALLAEECEEK